VRRFLLPLSSLLLLAAACGGASPTRPTDPVAAASTNGATISGVVLAARTTGSLKPSAVMTGLTVSVAGTTIRAVVDDSNRFDLKGVPAGDLSLVFSAPQFTASVGLPAVQSSDTISLSVSLGTSSVTIESETRSSSATGAEELEGRVESLPPSTAAGTFVVAGRTVLTDAGTQFVLGGSAAAFSDLAIGQRVHVKGQPSGADLAATIVDIQNVNTDIPVEINGTVQNFSGTVSAFQFDIDGRLIKGDATTEFFGNSVFADLADGVRAEVKGQQADGFVQATRIHVETPDAGDAAQDDSASVEGPLTSITGTPPLLTLLVGGTTVTTTASTVVRRRGDVQDLSTLQIGMTVHAEGARQTDGSIIARMVQIKDDEVGADFEIEGALGGLSGGCPVVTFGVNGYSIFTDGTTTFDPSCSALKSGSKVLVKGIVQADGRVKASSVEKK
jgi:Domain of unknown function (DUF5666)